MDLIVVIADSIGFLCFLAAVIVLALVPAREDRRYNRNTKAFTIAAFAVYVYSLGIHLFGATLSSPLWEEAENFVEVLFPVFVLMSVVSTLSAQQYLDLQRTGRALVNSHDMMFSIVDCAPAGILVLDTSGRATFANETARNILDLDEEQGTGALQTPGWTIVDRQGRGRPDFRVLTEGRAVGSRPVTVHWPNGWKVELEVYVEPLGPARSAEAYVATFEKPRRTQGS